MTESKRADMLRKIRAMLAKADSTNEQGEADVFREKAEALMLQYRIEEWELGAKSTDNSPIGQTTDFSWYWDSQHGGFLWSMMLDVAHHCRVKIINWKAGHEIPVVGLPSDIEYFDMLFTSLMLEMSKGLEPKPDPNKPMIENLVSLKESGQQWLRIAEQLHAIGQLTDEQFDPALRDDEPSKYGARYKERIKKQVHSLNFSGKYTAYCKEHDRERLRVTPKIYQRSFAYGFTTEISARLRAIRQHAMAQQKPTTTGSGMEVVLADIRTRVNAKALELYGNPPKSSGRGGTAREMRVDGGVIAKGREAAKNVDLGQTKVTTGRGALPRG